MNLPAWARRIGARGGVNGVAPLDAAALLPRANLTAGPDQLYRNAGTPEAAVTAAVGSIALDTTNGDLYEKTTGAGNTGWAKLLRGGSFTKALSDANYSLVATEYNKRTLIFTGALTADRTMTLPLTADLEYVVVNATTGGFNLIFQAASGASVTVAAGKTAVIRCDGVDYKRVTPDV